MLNTTTTTKIIKNVDRVVNAKVVIFYTEWNKKITQEISNKCVETLEENGIKKIEIIEVPGAVELPFSIQYYYQQKKNTHQGADIFIAIGCVIKGETPHFDYVCSMACNGILQLNLQLNTPIVMGILTVLTEEQAIDRIQEDNHKGVEFAQTALKLLLYKNSF